jgi:hypothetical protein
MAKIFYFKPKAEIDAERNLLEFINKCKTELTVFGGDLNWDAWKWPGAANFTKVGVSSRTNDEATKLDDSFIDFAKAYFRYQQGHNPTGTKNELKALRAIEVALLDSSASASIRNLSIPILDAASQVIRDKYSGGATYHGGRELERLAKFVTSNNLIAADLSGWRNPIARAKEDRNQTGIKAKERREKKLPSEEALMALAEIFAINPTAPLDIFTSSTFAITMCAPSRISEVLALPVDCEVEEVDSKGRVRYGWRFYSAKDFEGNIKWIPTEMVGIAKEAIKRLTQLTEEPRKLAKWIETNPGKFYRHAQCPDVADDYPLSVEQACLALGYSSDKKMIPKDTLKFMKLPYGDGENTLNSCWEYAMKRQPADFPWLDKEKKIKYSNALFCMQRNIFHSIRGLSPVILWGPSEDTFNGDLSPKISLKSGTRQSIFDRYGYLDAHGNRLKLTSHQARHFLDTIAERGGLSQLEIAKWSGRADPKQNRTYNHMSEYEMVAKAEALDTSLTLFGPSGEIEKHLPITIQEFNTLEKGAVHVTEYGVCVHDFTMTPCEKYRDCLNCSEQVCIKGENEKLVRIKARLSEVEHQFHAAETAISEGLAGADRWYEYHKNTMERLLELVSILEDPDLENGAQIKLRNDKSFSPLRRAIESKISTEAINSPDETKLLGDMAKLLGGGFG